MLDLILLQVAVVTLYASLWFLVALKLRRNDVADVAWGAGFLEDITPHYADTLVHWRRHFQANLDRVRHLGFSEEFIRTWEFYFCYCEGGFRERVIGDVQMVLTRPAYGRQPNA